MTEAMPFLQKYDITFLRPPTIPRGTFFSVLLLLVLLYNYKTGLYKYFKTGYI